MTGKNPLRSVGTGAERSPTDPYECAEWANSRMKPETVADGWRWIVRDGQIRFVREFAQAANRAA
jgi:hypothetical protein